MIAPRYTVVWTKQLATDLTNRWIEADSAERRLLTEITHLIDRNLVHDPNGLGHALTSEPGAHIWRLPGFHPPVSVVFQVLPENSQVRVVRLSIRVT